jgi:crossover junction endodeoxyribonuclease RusA
MSIINKSACGEDMIKLNVTFPPSANSIWRHKGRGMAYRSPKYMEWLQFNAVQVLIHKPAKIIAKPYKLTVLAVKPDKRKRDLDNLIKPLQDFLMHCHVVEDDSFCHCIEMKWVAEGNGCELIIEELNINGETF